MENSKVKVQKADLLMDRLESYFSTLPLGNLVYNLIIGPAIILFVLLYSLLNFIINSFLQLIGKASRNTIDEKAETNIDIKEAPYDEKTTTKYLYQTQTVAKPEQEEILFGDVLGEELREYSNEQDGRQLDAMFESKGSIGFTLRTAMNPDEVIPINADEKTPLQAKMIERKEREDLDLEESDRADIEELRNKLLAPREGGGAGRAIKFK